MMNEARNVLTPQASASALRMRLVDKVEGIVRESVKPMERIEGIKILHVAGLGGGGFLQSFVYHAQRGLQVESVVASVLMKLGYAEGIVYEFGAFDVKGPGFELWSSMSLPITGALVVVTAATSHGSPRVRAERAVRTSETTSRSAISEAKYVA